MADEQRPPPPNADEDADSHPTTNGDGEAYSHWLNLTGGRRQSAGDGARKPVTPSRPSTIEEHAKLKAAAKRQPHEPTATDIEPVKTDLSPREVLRSLDPPLPPAVSQDDLNLLMARLEDHSRMLASLRAELEKTANWHHVLIIGAIMLLLITGVFFLDSDTLLTAIRNL
ncbi:MAG: hypothetical protein O3A84_04095 [Proteobacteria bacterium]|nr:hypothetical protein [Pseudomonadota bacterium]